MPTRKLHATYTAAQRVWIWSPGWGPDLRDGNDDGDDVDGGGNDGDEDRKEATLDERLKGEK